MGSAAAWVWFGVSLYWAYCIFIGVKGLRGTKTASDYFIGGRSLTMWVLVPLWFVFAIGSGIVLGSDAQTFIFGLPKLWVWQIVWWLVGVVMMYVLAFRLQMSTPPTVSFEESASGEPR